MKSILTLSAIFAASLGARAQAQAQAQVQVGPHLGLNLATAAYAAHGYTLHPTALLRGEVGATVQVSRAHLALQVSALYTQKGFRIREAYGPTVGTVGPAYQTHETYRLNYLALPVSLAYSPRPDGQGLQVFGGGYLALLLGGEYTYDNQQLAQQPNGDVYGYNSSGTATVQPGQRQVPRLSAGAPNEVIFSRPLDLGVQAGLGYRYGRLLVQAGYSLGFTNLFPDAAANVVVIHDAAQYRTRTAQLSATYLFGAAR